MKVVHVYKHGFERPKWHVSYKIERFSVVLNVEVHFCHSPSFPNTHTHTHSGWQWLRFPLPLGSNLTYRLPAENSQEHLEGKVLPLRLVNMGICCRSCKDKCYPSHWLNPLSWCPWPSKFVGTGMVLTGVPPRVGGLIRIVPNGRFCRSQCAPSYIVLPFLPWLCTLLTVWKDLMWLGKLKKSVGCYCLVNKSLLHWVQ